jgi:hypothetical protein
MSSLSPDVRVTTPEAVILPFTETEPVLSIISIISFAAALLTAVIFKTFAVNPRSLL